MTSVLIFLHILTTRDCKFCKEDIEVDQVTNQLRGTYFRLEREVCLLTLTLPTIIQYHQVFIFWFHNLFLIVKPNYSYCHY